MPTCDVVIPTYNNADVLPYTLRALFSQYVPPNWTPRLITSDDGSSDDTVAILKKYPTSASWLPTGIVAGPHTGVAGARNRGLSMANADIILLLGADIILLPGALAAHFNFHTERPNQLAGALGMIKWDPRLSPTPLMEWMAHGGPQNNFDALLGKTITDPAHFFYGSHISLKNTLLGPNPFSENYHSYGWEDADLGRQLANRGFTLHILHNALSLHRHYYTVQNITQRQRYVGKNIVVYQKRYPGTRLIPPQTRLQKARHAALTFGPLNSALHILLSLTARTFSTPWLFSRITSTDFWYGVKTNKNRQFSP
ncbi:MAG: glycosyltransferase family 2 protein [bacterium]